MTKMVARLIFPFSIVVAIALWARSYAEVGDGFSAGAIAGLGAAVQYIALDHDHARYRTQARWAPVFLAVGLLLALAVMLVPLAGGLPPVTHFPRPGSSVAQLGEIEFHTAVLFDLGIAVTVYGALTGTFDKLFPPLKGDEP